MSRQPSPEQAEQYLNSLRLEAQTQLVQSIVNGITENCFKKCAGKSGDSLDSRETNCMSNCIDRYQETMVVINRNFILILKAFLNIFYFLLGCTTRNCISTK